MRVFACLGEDGQVRVRDLDSDVEHLVSRAGRNEEAATCAWPTWSPDGTQLAYFRYEITGGELRATSLQVAAPDGSANRRIHRFEGSLPIYLNWSPDGRQLALLMQGGRQLALHIVSSDGNAPPMVAARGAPLYFAWHPNARALLAHVGTDEPVPGSRFLWLRMEGDKVVTEPVPVRPAPGFRAPAWWAQRAGMTVARDAGDGAEIVLLRTPGEDPELLFPCGAAPALVWSPSGAVLACGAREEPESGTYAGLSVYRADQGKVERLTDTALWAFFWTPDERHLLYCTEMVGDRQMGLCLLGVSPSSEADLGFVRPSRELLQLLGHFDQYTQSAQIISPSGDELLLAASRAKERENGSIPTVRQVLLRSLGLGGEERVLGRGRLAFWRPGGSNS